MVLLSDRFSHAEARTFARCNHAKEFPEGGSGSYLNESDTDDKPDVSPDPDE